MRRVWIVLMLGALFAPAAVSAGNSDEVNGGVDVTLTGGAVVATVYTGASLWYNPAGIARASKASLELTGVTLQIQIINAPGVLTLESGETSPGKTTNFSVIPQALTFTIGLRDNLKLGIGFFNSSIRRSFVTEEVSSSPGASPTVSAVGGQNSRLDFFHISSGVAGEFGRKQRVRVGGAFDFVVATSRVDGILSAFYDNGRSGFYTDGVVETQTGFGLQLKAGIQWVPIPKLRFGFSVASPTYTFFLLERSATTFGQAPPAGTMLSPDDPNAQASGGTEQRTGRGGWWGVEPGNLRAGIAYVADWGWFEADLVIGWRLQTPDLGIDLQAVVNGKIGTNFRLTKFVKLGLGLFTDFSPVDELAIAPLATTDVNFYGAHLGFLFSNQEVHPDRIDPDAEEDRAGFAIAIGLRYAHGRGDLLGLEVPSSYDPASITTTAATGARVNQLSLNFAAKVAF